MYSTCLFCHRTLGQNDRVEAFPVGQRLAFDAARGRLWVVCAACGRWNLTPLEERWEAIEECERLFGRTPCRVSTEHVGLTRLTSGLELIRVGRPLRPEFAAWRYGAELVRRHQRDLMAGISVLAGSVVGLLGASVGAGAVVGPVGAIVPPVTYVAGAVLVSRRQLRRIVARVAGQAGDVVYVRAKHLSGIEFLPSVERDGGRGHERPETLRLIVRTGAGVVEVTGAAATRIAALACARRNTAGATQRVVRAAVEHLERHDGPTGVLRHAARVGPLSAIGYHERLALEMALHEETERRALDGELRLLEAAWREAEEVAMLADNLLVPDGVMEMLERLRVQVGLDGDGQEGRRRARGTTPDRAWSNEDGGEWGVTV